MWYNLAGIEEQLDDRTAAEEAFAEAVALGFDDFRYAQADADLGDALRARRGVKVAAPEGAHAHGS